jgi:DNA-binding transcriptional LysR family regulator
MGRYRQLEVFAAVVQAGSLTAAARKLELSPATIMRTVAALETRLGTALLSRGPRGTSLTPTGERFAASCKLILLETAEAERCATGLHCHPAGALTVAVPLSIANRAFTPLAMEYLESCPGVRLQVHIRESMPRLLEEGIDVALVVGALADSSDFAVPIGAARPIICGSPAYLARYGRPRTAEDLRGHRSVVATTTSQALDWRLRGEGRTHAVKPTPILTCSTQQAAIRAAVCGLGLTRCMSYEADEELRNGLLEPVLENYMGPPQPVQLIYRDGRRASARVRSFIDFAAPRLRVDAAFHVCNASGGCTSLDCRN